MDAKRKIETTMRVADLAAEERLVLEALLKAGYTVGGSPMGKAGGLSAGALAAHVYGLSKEPQSHQSREEWAKDMESHKRKLRFWVNRLIIKHRIPIMCQAGSGGGYYLPSDSGEVEANRRRFFDRAMTGLMKASRSKEAYVEGMVQLTMGIHGSRGREFFEKYGAGADDEPGKDGPPPWVQVVTGVMDQMAKADPDSYAAQLRELQRTRGDIFVRQDKVKLLRQRIDQLKEAVEGLSA